MDFSYLNEALKPWSEDFSGHESVVELKSDIRFRQWMLAFWELIETPSIIESKLAALSKIEKSVYIELFAELWEQLPHKMIKHHYALIRKAAATYHQKALVDDEGRFQDLLSAGTESLFRSARKFFLKPKGNFKVMAWEGLKRDYRAEQNNRHPVPTKVRKKLSALNDLRQNLSSKEIFTSDKVLAQGLNMNAQQLADLLQIESVWGTGAEFETDVLIEEIEEPDLSASSLQLLLHSEQYHLVQGALSELSEREKEMIKRIFFNEKSLREVADEMGVSFKIAKKIYKSALVKLKIELKDLV